MAFYPIPFGHAEVHTDPRPNRPVQYSEEVPRRKVDTKQERRTR